jgi:hypothetical protein
VRKLAIWSFIERGVSYLQPDGVEGGLVEDQTVYDLFALFLVRKSAENSVPNDQNAAVVLVQAVQVCAYGRKLKQL